MRKLLLLLILSFSIFFANAQNVNGDELRIYKGAQIGEDGTTFPLNMHGNNVTNVKDPINLLDAVNKQWFMANMSLTQPLDSLSLTPLTESDIQTEYTLFADTLSFGGSFNTGLGNYVYKLGQATVLLYYNDNVFTIDAFDVLHLKSGALVNGKIYPTPELADASDWEKTQGTLSVAAHSIAPGEFGFSVIYGVLNGGDTSALTAGEQIWVSDDGSGHLTSTRPEFQSYAISMGGAANSETAPNGQILVNITRDIYDTFNDGWDGAIRETFDFRITSNGSTVTGSLENVINSNNLTLLFSDGFSTFDTTPAATLTLVSGTATTVQMNYVFIDKATKTLQVSTSGFPLLEYSEIAVVGLFDAGKTQSDGAIRNQNTNNHIKKEDDNGHILHISARIRQLNAEHNSGTETILSGTPTNLQFSNTAGSVWQLHLHDFPALDMSTGDDIHVVNDPTTAYRTTTNLNDITEFSDGSNWNNEWSNITVWGIANKTGETSHLMVNLPSDGYNSEEDAFNDNENFTNYNIPKDFKGVGFLMGRFTIRRSGSNFTYNLSAGYLDLRGFIPNNTIGSGGGGPSGITSLLSLNDTPVTFIGFAGQALVVNALETATEFSPVVTSINGNSPTLGNYDIVMTQNKVGEVVTLNTSGTGVSVDVNIADNDNVIGNEFQDLSSTKLNNTFTIEISDGTNTTVTNIVRTDFANTFTEFNRFSGGISSSLTNRTRFGFNAASSNTGGSAWTAIGSGAGDDSTTGDFWTAIGLNAGGSSIDGNDWLAVGQGSGFNNTTGDFWTAIGNDAGGNNINGSAWTAIGNGAANGLINLQPATAFSNSVYLGAGTRASSNGVTNENVFGYAADGQGSNTVTIGNSSITDNFFNGNVDANSLSTSGVERISSAGDAEFRFLDGTGLATLKNGLIAGLGGVEKFRATSDGLDALALEIGGVTTIDPSRNFTGGSGDFGGSVRYGDLINHNIQSIFTSGGGRGRTLYNIISDNPSITQPRHDFQIGSTSYFEVLQTGTKTTGNSVVSATASTTAPSFQVAASSSLANSDIVRFQINGLTNGFRMYQNTSSGVRYSFENGNVGIGIVDATEKLDILGNIKATGSGTFGDDVEVTGNITATNVFKKATQTLSGTTPTYDTSVSVNAEITLTGNTTATLTNLVDGMSGDLDLTQDGTGGWTLTFSPTPDVINGGGGVITLTGTALSNDIISWKFINGRLKVNYGLNYN